MASSFGKIPTTSVQPLDLAIEAIDRMGAVQLGAVLDRKGHIGEHVGLSFVHEGGELGQLGTGLVGDAAPLKPGRFGVAAQIQARNDLHESAR
jgi:hypothetical protein